MGAWMSTAITKTKFAGASTQHNLKTPACRTPTAAGSGHSCKIEPLHPTSLRTGGAPPSSPPLRPPTSRVM